MKKTFLISLSALVFIGACQKNISYSKFSNSIAVTLPANEVTDTSVILFGAVVREKTDSVLDYGFCWAMSPNPSIQDSKVTLDERQMDMSYSYHLMGLRDSTTFYYRAYAYTQTGLKYGEIKSFVTLRSCRLSALYFDGIYINNSGSFQNDHIDIGTNGPMSEIQNTKSYTIEAWAKRKVVSYPGGFERIYSKDNVFEFRVLDDHLEAEIGSASIGTLFPADTFWHHLAFVRDRSNLTLRLYIDGQLQCRAPDSSGEVGNNGNMVTIGARNNGNGIYELWGGYLSNLRVSDTARYSHSFHPSRNLLADYNTLALWPMDEGEGNTAHDRSGHGFDGNIVGAEWVSDSCRICKSR